MCHAFPQRSELFLAFLAAVDRFPWRLTDFLGMGSALQSGEGNADGQLPKIRRVDNDRRPKGIVPGTEKEQHAHGGHRGLDEGAMMVRTMRTSPAPSMRATSIKSAGVDSIP